MQKPEDIFKAMLEFGESMEKYQRVLSQGPASYYYKKFAGYYEGCMAASAFKVGDTVYLKEATNCNNGWRGSEHFLVKDAEAIVAEVDYDKGRYIYHVIFENESWINQLDKKVTPITKENRHWYGFSQDKLYSKPKGCPKYAWAN